MLIEAIKKRGTIRRYNPSGTVTDEQIKELLEAAMLAPSAHNSRPWEFIVSKDKDMLNQMASIPNSNYQAFNTASIAIIVCANMNLQYKDFWPQDCGAATQNILLQATELGLGACWCGVYPREDRVVAVREMLQLTENIMPVNLIAVGVPAQDLGGRGYYEEKKVKWLD